MSKTLTNKQYYEAVIKPTHIPVARQEGTKYVIVCCCSAYKEGYSYLDHIVEILNHEFKFFDERYGVAVQDYYGR